jgi:hypothetical protein
MKKIEIDKNLLITYLTSGKPKQEIARVFNITTSTLRKIIKEYGVQSYYTFNRELDGKAVVCDVNFFKTLDNENSSYVFGFLLADGWLRSDGKSLGFQVTETDIDVLHKIKEVMRLKSPLVTPIQTGFKSRPAKRLDIRSKEVVRDLINLGITPRKSFDAKLPMGLSKANMLHLLRGLFDGDGSFSQNNPCIASSSKQLVDDVCSWVYENYSYKPSVNIQKSIAGEECYKVYFTKNLFQLMVDMYTNHSISLDRKQKAFEEYYKHRIKNL